MNKLGNYDWPRIKPVPVLELVPGLPPRKKVVMVAILLMIGPGHAHINLGFVQERSTILTNSWFVLTSDQCTDQHHHYNQCLHHDVVSAPVLCPLVGSSNTSEHDHDPEHVSCVRVSGSRDQTGQRMTVSLCQPSQLVSPWYLLYWSELQVKPLRKVRWNINLHHLYHSFSGVFDNVLL